MFDVVCSVAVVTLDLSSEQFWDNLLWGATTPEINIESPLSDLSFYNVCLALKKNVTKRTTKIDVLKVTSKISYSLDK